MLNYRSFLLTVVMLAGTNEVNMSVAEYTKFCLHTRSSGSKCYKLAVNDTATLKNSTFDAEKSTKVIIPGWFDPAYDMKQEVRTAYIEAQDVNVITYDWMYYTLVARLMVDSVGAHVAQFLDWLVAETGVSADSIHLVGFSLGAQLAGVVGEKVTVGKLGRITALDPVGRSFNKASTAGRLDSGDAQFVDVIHTSTMGYSEPCGHVDFFPNGGNANQPGCSLLDFGVCSHTRAFKYFVESMTSDKFVGRKCDNWTLYENGQCADEATAVMGEHVNMGARGNYYLRTSKKSPFALG